MVSVFMLVYNQEGFISQTLESILHQKTTFPFNIVIGEDCSTDHTRAIIEGYKEQFPDKIKVITSDHNVGLINNFIRTVNQCDGKYIAICDGDDFWTDEYKLQMQVDFLEQHPEYSLVYTRKLELMPDGSIVENKNVKPTTTDFSDLIKNNYIPSVTALFKNKVNGNQPLKWLHKYPYGDWPLYLFILNDGSKIKFIDKATAVWRKNIGISTNIRSSHSRLIKVNINILNDIYDDELFKHHRKIIDESLIKHKVHYMMSLVAETQLLKSFKVYCQLLGNVSLLKLSKWYFYSLNKRYIKLFL